MIERDTRKNVSALLRKLDKIDTEDHEIQSLIDKLKEDNPADKIANALRVNNNCHKAHLLADFASDLIRSLNGAEAMCFKTEEVVDQERRKQHPNNVKQALYSLRLLNLLEKISNTQDETEQAKYQKILEEDFDKKRSQLKQGLKNIVAASMNKNQPQQEKQTEEAPETRRSARLSEKKQSSERVFKMTDSEVAQEAEQLITKSDKLIEFFKKAKKSHLIAEIIGEKVGFLFDYPNQHGRQADNLFNFTARHLAIVFHSFSNLKSFIENDQSDDFKCVMENLS